MDDGALDDALESRRRLRIRPAIEDEVREFGVNVFDEVATQQVDIDAAGPHHRGGVLVVDQREQKVFERGVFVPPLARKRERTMEGLF